MLFGIDFGTYNTVISINDNGVKVLDVIPTQITYNNITIRNFKNKDIKFINLFILSLKNGIFKKYKDISAVISVPNMFSSNYISNIMKAFNDNDIKIIKVIKEPVAAITYYSIYNNIKNITVFDMGCGTTDISIAEIDDGFIDIIDSYGYNNLGSNNINNNLINYFNTTDYNAEIIKRKINICKDFNISINNIIINIDRQLFEKINNNIICKIKEIKNKIKGDIILVGGGCKSYFIKDIFKTTYDSNVMTCVSMGCCYYGLNMMNCLPNKNLVIMETTNSDLNVMMDNGNIVTVIDKNTQIPCSVSHKFIVNNINLDIVILQGNTIINNIIYKLKDLNTNVITLEFNIDRNNVITVIMKDNYNISSFYKFKSNNTTNNFEYQLDKYQYNMNKSLLLSILNKKIKSTNNNIVIKKTTKLINNINNMNINTIMKYIEENKQFNIISIKNNTSNTNNNSITINIINNIINKLLLKDNLDDKYINFIKKAQNIIDIVNIDNIELNNIIKEFRQL